MYTYCTCCKWYAFLYSLDLNRVEFWQQNYLCCWTQVAQGQCHGQLCVHTLTFIFLFIVQYLLPVISWFIVQLSVLAHWHCGKSRIVRWKAFRCCHVDHVVGFYSNVDNPSEDGTSSSNKCNSLEKYPHVTVYSFLSPANPSIFILIIRALQRKKEDINKECG